MRAAIVSCHVESVLDDRAWSLFSRLQASRPAGFRIAPFVRPPDPSAGEDERRWLERVRTLDGPLGLHTHWTSAVHARPTHGDTALRVRHEVGWLRAHGLEPRFFVGGGWYTDERVREELGELGLVECTATTFRPAYLGPEAARLEVDGPTTLDGLRVIPATHSLGMLVRAVVRQLPEFVHAYFHDTDLVDARRRAALRGALRVLALRRPVSDLNRVCGR